VLNMVDQSFIMTQPEQMPAAQGAGYSPSLRDVVAVGFRRRRLIVLSFLGIFLGAIAVAVLTGSKYQAQMKILVRHRRADPVVSSAGGTGVVQIQTTQVGEEETNSEVQLIESSDLLEEVVVACGLDKVKPRFWSSWIPTNPALRIPEAVRKLKEALTVETVRKTNLIEVTYTSTDPQLAARVLNTLGDLYLERHVAVNRFPGQLDFFDRQAERYRKSLEDTESRLVSFARDQGTVAAESERDILLEKVADLEATQVQNQAAIASQIQRIQALEKQLPSTPQRLSTQSRTTDNAALLEQLKATLLNLRLKRTELLAKYDPSYRAVKEVDAQIAQTEANIATEENAPVRENTTDQNPTYQWIVGELAKAKADLPTLKANADATANSVRDYRSKLQALEQKGVEQTDLLRAAKAEEASYLLYQNKREEARIADALDAQRIANVVIAEAATVPALPTNSPWVAVLLGGILASVVSVSLAFAAERLDSRFRTPDEVRQFLNVPVFAAIPKEDRRLTE
jgi:polysaccharide biosynthesis protein PslE